MDVLLYLFWVINLWLFVTAFLFLFQKSRYSSSRTFN